MEWSAVLEGLEGEPHLMLLGAVVLRAVWDVKGSSGARAFLERVRENVRAGCGSAEAVLLAMDGVGADGAPVTLPERRQVVGVWW